MTTKGYLHHDYKKLQEDVIPLFLRLPQQGSSASPGAPDRVTESRVKTFSLLGLGLSSSTRCGLGEKLASMRYTTTPRPGCSCYHFSGFWAPYITISRLSSGILFCFWGFWSPIMLYDMILYYPILYYTKVYTWSPLRLRKSQEELSTDLGRLTAWDMGFQIGTLFGLC